MTYAYMKCAGKQSLRRAEAAPLPNAPQFLTPGRAGRAGISALLPDQTSQAGVSGESWPWESPENVLGAEGQCSEREGVVVRQRGRERGTKKKIEYGRREGGRDTG